MNPQKRLGTTPPKKLHPDTRDAWRALTDAGFVMVRQTDTHVMLRPPIAGRPLYVLALNAGGRGRTLRNIRRDVERAVAEVQDWRARAVEEVRAWQRRAFRGWDG